MKYISLILIFGNVLFAQVLFSQHNVKGSVEVYFDDYENLVTNYPIEENKTIYKAAKLFHRSVNLLLEYNDLSSAKAISKGSEIQVPIDFAFVFRGIAIKGYKNTKFLPLVYTVKPKDNLFRIAKVYCGESVKTMMKRNKIKSKNLRIGQELIVGWLPIDSQSKQYLSSVEKTKEPKVEEPSKLESMEEPLATMVKLVDKDEVMEINDAPASSSEDGLLPEELEEDNWTREKGIAIWTKSSKGHSRYALHPTAKLNSEIELYNPLVNRTVKAKVIGRIPEGAYKSDVSVIISPATAVSLGALDSRFSIEMKYNQ